MWRVVLLGLMVLAVEAPTAWYVGDLAGTLAADEVACDRWSERTLEVRVHEGEPEGTLFLANPYEHEVWYWGGLVELVHHRVRWDGRLEAGRSVLVQSDFAEGYEGIRVPGGTEVAVTRVPLPEEPGEHVVLLRMENHCGLQRLRIA